MATAAEAACAAAENVDAVIQTGLGSANDAGADQAAAAADTAGAADAAGAPDSSCSAADRRANKTLQQWLSDGCPLPAALNQTGSVQQCIAEELPDKQVPRASLSVQLAILHKLQQLEKAAHFGERRQDAQACLPSERERHRAALQQNVDEWKAELRKPEAATLCCQAKLIEAKQQLAKHKWDSFTAAGQYGCCSQAVAGLQLFFPVFSRKWSCLRVAE